MTVKTTLPSLLLAASLLFFTGCGDNNTKTSTQTVDTSSAQSATATPSQPTGTPEEVKGLKGLSLTVNKTNLNKDENTTVKVTATYDNGSSKEVTDKVEWIVSPQDAVAVTQHMLMAKKDKPATIKAKLGDVLSNEVSLTITWVVNGHTLPPEPDPTVNNATLLGVDINNNGVRDDVERWIYESYDHPIERGIFMQSARAYQKVIVDPKKAHATVKYIDKASDCEQYWRYWKLLYKDRNEEYVLERYRNLEKEIGKIQFNTIDRIIDYKRFNGELSGGVYGSTGISKQKCEFDENGILKALP